MRLSIRRRTCYDSNSLAYLISGHLITEQFSNFICQKSASKKLFIEQTKSARSPTTMSNIIFKHDDHVYSVISLKQVFRNNIQHRFIYKHNSFTAKDSSIWFKMRHNDEITMYDYIESSRHTIREKRRRKRYI